jgi:hypothetical protein
MTWRSQSSIDVDIDKSADFAITAMAPAAGIVATDRAIKSAKMVRHLYMIEPCQISV